MKILIVEDEVKIASGIWTILEREGYQVDVEYDGISGLDAIKTEKYDMVLLDIMLPGIDGIQILEKSRRAGIKVPIIILTAKSLVDDKIIGLDCGADDYLTKPFDAGELLARIRAVSRRLNLTGDKNMLQSNRLTAFDLELERSSYMLSSYEKSVKLSNKEYQLLEYMMINRGRILTREMLALRVWGLEDESNYNHLDVYISFLRKKLRFIGAKAAIITTKNVGYSLEKGDGCID